MSMTSSGAPFPNAVDTRFANARTPGRNDGFGDRWLGTDPDDSTAVELLRFRHDVADTPGFEDSLRGRVELLKEFKDLAFVPVREVIREHNQLTLVSESGTGQRLSEVAAGKLKKSLRPAFVARVMKEVTGALTALEAIGDGVTHGAITADRILVTPEGRVRITEYALAPALEQLALWPEELWTDFSILARADEDGQAVFDSRTTLMQLAVAGLSVLLARPVTLQEFNHRLPALLDEFSTASQASPVTLPLRAWFERALQLGADGFQTAADAETALKKLLAGLGPAGAVEVDTFQYPPRASRHSDIKGDHKGTTETSASDALESEHESVTTPAPVPAATSWVRTRRAPWYSEYALWGALVLAVIAVGEAIVIARLLLHPPTLVVNESAVTIESPQAGDTVLVDGKPMGSTPLQLRVNPQMHAIRLVPAPTAVEATIVDPAADAAKAESDRDAAALELAATRQRSGGVAFSSPIELKVLEGDRVLGSSADGAIVASAGTHQLDLVNTSLGYRSRQTVTIKPGVITRLTVAPPMGRISINAQPWAQVLIDDLAVGETPLANIPVAIGDHQITFRHPQLGERRERVTVRADTPARISTSLQR